jgi:hypothetical protein
MKRFTQALLCVLVVAALCSAAQATLVIAHHGQTDPLSEGWLLAYGTEASGWENAHGVNDGGVDAWYIAPDTTKYELDYSLTADQAAEANDYGWEYTWKVRAGYSPLVPKSDKIYGVAGGAGMAIGVEEGTNNLLLTNPMTDQPITVTGIAAGSGLAYHDYKLKQAAGNTSVELYVDNILQTTLAGAQLNTTSAIQWGKSNWTGEAGGYWASVELNTLKPIPEPSSVVMLVVGLFSLLAYAWKRRR